MDNLEKENQELKGNLSSISSELSNKTRENKKLADKMEDTQISHDKVKGIKKSQDSVNNLLISSAGVWPAHRTPVNTDQTH